ncbi:MAG: protoheme IX farnesyltransferase [Nitrospiraceae bacterium]|nr:protoheme IX farnesyltransferase [Nitrospiraceae bacterium]
MNVGNMDSRKWLELCRIRISFFSVLAAATGYLLAAPRPGTRIALLAPGVMLLACGASAINQFLERKTDALMPRTSGRPVPSGRTSPAGAFLFSICLISLGTAALFWSRGPLPAGMGLFTAFWYGAVYTPLKRKTPFAVAPGALTGAMPFAIGWAYAGGSLSDPRCILPCFFFYMWQMPHFWLFISQYGGEYEKAGLPSLTKVFSERQLARVICSWSLSCGAGAMLLAYCASGGIIIYGLAAAAACLALSGAAMLKMGSEKKKNKNYLFAWRGMNAAMFAVMCLLSADRIF